MPNIDYTVKLTDYGRAKLAQAEISGIPVEITHMAVSDSQEIPTAADIDLGHEVYRDLITEASVSQNDPGLMQFELIVPNTVGGFWMRKVGVFDADGGLIYVAAMPQEYKPAVPEVVGKECRVTALCSVGNADNVQLVIDPSVLLATRNYVDRLRADLADDTASVNGAGLVGFDKDLNYSDGTIGGWIKSLLSEIGASLVGFINSGVGAVKRTVQDKLRDQVSAADLGMIANVAEDQSAAFERCLKDDRDVVVTEGTYTFTVGNIVVPAGGRKRIIGRGKVVFSVNLPAGTSLCDLSRAIGLDNIEIDFNNGYLRNGFFYRANSGHIRWRDIAMRNIRDIDHSYGTLGLCIYLVGNTFDIAGVKFSSCLKRGNGVIAESAGSFNGIYVGQPDAPVGTTTVGRIENISAAEVHNIDAAGNIMYEDTAAVYVATPAGDTGNNITIRNVDGYQFGKRLVKVHASNVAVSHVTGVSTTGDTLGVVGFLTGDVLGEKTGCSASHLRGYGKMEYAFYNAAPGVRWKDLIADIQPCSLPGMSDGAVGLGIGGSDTVVDGLTSKGRYLIGIGSPLGVTKNIRLRNIDLAWVAGTTAFGFTDLNGSQGIDGLEVDGLKITVDSPAAAVIPIANTYATAALRWKNVRFNSVEIISNAAANSYGALLSYVDDVVFGKFKYTNTSGALHYRGIHAKDSTDVVVRNFIGSGLITAAVTVQSCVRALIDRVVSPEATYTVFNASSTGVTVGANTDLSKVISNVAGTKISLPWTIDTTANRPPSPVNGQPHYDTTIGKPIWYNAAAGTWKDSSGINV